MEQKHLSWLTCSASGCLGLCVRFNTLRLRQDGRHFPDDIFKCIYLNENAQILLKKSLKFVPKVRMNNIPALVQIMAWRRPGDKPLCEPMMVSLPTHICVTRSQWVNGLWQCRISMWNSSFPTSFFPCLHDTFVDNLFFRCPFISTFSSEYGSGTAMLFAKSHN